MKPETKTCSKCKRVLLRGEFYRDQPNKDGLRYECKTCNKIYRKQNKNIDILREQWKRYREKNKTKRNINNVKWRLKNPGYKKEWQLRNPDKNKEEKVISNFCQGTTLKPRDLPEELKKILIMNSTLRKLNRNKRKELQNG